MSGAYFISFSKFATGNRVCWGRTSGALTGSKNRARAQCILPRCSSHFLDEYLLFFQISFAELKDSKETFICMEKIKIVNFPFLSYTVTLNGSDFIECSPSNNLFLLTSTLSSGVQ